MKLTNPTDDELNAAFAERVAGWMQCERLGRMVWYDPEGGHVAWRDIPRFIESFDAVLPSLEKWHCEIGNQITLGTWLVLVRKSAVDKQYWRGCESSLPRAAVIALLFAHGIKIEFT